jgi:hypothetical protein
MKKQVTIKTLEARIKNRLIREGRRLTKFSKRWASTYGSYGIIDLANNTVSAYNISIEDLAKEMGLLAGFEEVAYV